MKHLIVNVLSIAAVILTLFGTGCSKTETKVNAKALLTTKKQDSTSIAALANTVIKEAAAPISNSEYISFKFLEFCDGTTEKTKFKRESLWKLIKELAPEKAHEIMYRKSCNPYSISFCSASKLFPRVYLQCSIGNIEVDLSKLREHFIEEKTVSLAELRNQFFLRGGRVSEGLDKGKPVTFSFFINKGDTILQTASEVLVAGESYSSNASYRTRVASLISKMENSLNGVIKDEISLPKEGYDFGLCNASFHQAAISHDPEPAYVLDGGTQTYYTVKNLAGCASITEQGYQNAKSAILEYQMELRALDGEIRQ